MRFQQGFGTLQLLSAVTIQLDTKFNKSEQVIRDSSPSWQKILAQGFKTSSELLSWLNIPVNLANTESEAAFATRVPLGYASRIQKGNPDDPLLLQVLASSRELLGEEGYVKDPLHEKAANKEKGLIHKYKNRVLLTFTGVCAIHCRYCFRRHFPYADNNPGRQGWSRALEYVANDSNIDEVILSGGDPLLASDEVLMEFLHELSTIPHVRTVRFHTRIPVVLPERITGSFLEILKSCTLKKVIVMHSNHAQELDDTVFAACEALHKAGCYLLNQSVLLAGINDSVDILKHLSHRLFECRILPYYLHVPDKVEGTSHFDVPLQKALKLFQELQTELPGYLVPRLAREEPGKPGKTLLGTTG